MSDKLQFVVGWQRRLRNEKRQTEVCRTYNMENYIWIFWTILGAILVIAEIFTSGFVLLWFGIGALAAGFAGLIGIHSITLQFLIFAVVSIGLTAASRTIFVQYFSRERTGGDLKSGVEGLPGKVGTVVSSSRGALHEGAVKV